MTTLTRLAWRNLLRHPWRSLATALGIGLGIAAVLTTLSVGDNVEANLRSTLQAAAGKADLVITPGPSGRIVFESQGVLEQARSYPGVLAAYPVLNTRAEPLRDVEEFERSAIPGVDSGFQIQGRLTEFPQDLPAETSVGELPRAGTRGIAVADGFAESRGIRVGDVVPFTTAGGLAELTVIGLLDDGVGVASTNGGRVGIMHLEDLESLINLTGRVSVIEIQVDPATTVATVQQGLQELVGSDLAVTLPAVTGDFAAGFTETLQSGLSVLAATLLALGAFLAYNTFMASVVERTREHALLRTIGLTRRDVLRLALLEALALSIIGIVVGLGLGVVLSYVVTSLNAATLGFEFRTLVMPVRSVVVASLLGVVAALAAGLIPAWSAARTSPMAAVQRPESGPGSRHVGVGILFMAIGAGLALYPFESFAAIVVVCFALAIFFAGVSLAAPGILGPVLRLLRPVLLRVFGASGRLGASFAQRNAARNGVAIGTVVVGTGLIIGVGSMVASINRAIAGWMDTTVVGDLYVTTPVSFQPDFAQRAEAVDGVDVASGVGIRLVRFVSEEQPRGRSVALILADPARFDPDGGFGSLQYIPGHGDAVSGHSALERGDAVLVSNTMLDRHGFGVGDSISLRTSNGFEDFPIAGVIVDFTGGGEAVLTSIENMPDFGGGSPDLYILTVDPGRDPPEVRERLLAEFPELYLDVTLNVDYRRTVLELTDQAFATTRVLLVIAVLVAVLGVANTLGMNLVNRGHEIAVLRTIGLTRTGLRWLVVAEGAVITLIGGALGAGFGLLLARIVTTGAGAVTGFRLEPVVPVYLALLAVLVSPLVGLVASLLPARRAAMTAPAKALAAWSEHV
ncbi:MAG TPA: FtsX-like permease family protein [Trueperaceae bacterium]|nr:FtsX-like permease family protein [Trueperaceae bacterium]